LTNQNTNYAQKHHSNYIPTEEDTIEKESSICESELEFTIHGNIRACAYKRDEENQKVRDDTKRYKSEERKPTEYFTHDYLQGRYMNDRVEMELEEFKKEIKRKFNSSLL
jgi:hypothetical protein